MISSQKWLLIYFVIVGSGHVLNLQFVDTIQQTGFIEFAKLRTESAWKFYPVRDNLLRCLFNIDNNTFGLTGFIK